MVFLKKSKKFVSSYLISLVLAFLPTGGLTVLWNSSPSFAQDSSTSYLSEIEEINRAIRAAGAQWAAGETSLSGLSLAEKQKRLGFLPPPYEEEQLRNLPSEPVGAPASLDWRNNGGDFVTDVRDQKQCGSCWAFATTAALESSVLITMNAPNTEVDLSEQVLVSCGNSGSCNGGYPSYASNFIQNTGLPLESCYPYTGTNGNCANACANWQSSTYKIVDWWGVSKSVDALKNALYTYGPLVTTMQVYQDFFNYSKGVYSYVSGSLAGGHAILLVGYDDAGQYFICKNSWGTWWGESGFFRIGYSEIHSKTQLGGFATLAYIATPACSVDVSQPSPASFSASGGSGTVSVTAANSCSWTASSNDSWIGITSGASGTGNGTVTFSVSANNGASRTGSLRIGGQTLSVTQSGGSTCTYSISPAQQTFDAAGGNGSVAVTAVGTSCAWIA
jgi:C1A family cysteine protease